MTLPTFENVLKVLGAIGALGLVAFVQWLITFLYRRSDQGWRLQMEGQMRLVIEKELKTHEAQLRTLADGSLERMKGDIRREIEENLKTHESRLRIDAELRLRAHDRSWGLLREFTALAWKLREKLNTYTLAAAGDYENKSTAY